MDTFSKHCCQNFVNIHYSGDLFKIKRGIATGCNEFFILPEEQIIKRKLPFEVFKPILPGPRYITGNIIEADKKGNPVIDKPLYLLDTSLTEEQIKHQFPSLWNYLEEGKALGVHKGYLCSSRTPWYSQEKRPAAPVICTYMGRGNAERENPFRFILNKSSATISNGYLAMYPTAELLKIPKNDPPKILEVWNALNNIGINNILGESRVYGGGLHKLEPKELANVPLSI